MSTDNHGNERERGPGFADIDEYARSIEADQGGTVLFEIFSIRSVNKRWGMHITARVAGTENAKGYAGYGPAYPGTGGKTFAASMYRALVKLDEDIHRIRPPDHPQYVNFNNRPASDTESSVPRDKVR